LALDLLERQKRRPHVLGLTAEAKRRWIDFFNEWGVTQYDAEGEQASAFAKIEAYTPRLALVHHCVALAAAGVNDLRSVTEASLGAAITLARWFAHEATRIYAMLHESQEKRDTLKLVEWVATHGAPVPGRPGARRVTVRQLQNSNSRRPDAEDDNGDGLPTPARVRLAARRAAGIAEAKAVLAHLPGPGESLHALCTARMDLTDVIGALLERLGRCDHLHVATLG
jgi:hypothetical protein